MADRKTAMERLCRQGVIAVVRAKSGSQLLEVAGALLAGGVDCVEITMTTPNALEVIAQCRRALGEKAMIGVGSVLSAAVARQAIQAGAQYVVSPIFKAEIVQAAHEAGLPCVPGSFTPTEILTATEAGAGAVKVFPGGAVGPQYIRDLLAPMPHLKLTPTGGVTLETAAEWIAAGAVTLGIGSALVTRKALAEGDFAGIQRLAEQYVRIVAEARAGRGGR